jgi:hypothetical protein
MDDVDVVSGVGERRAVGMQMDARRGTHWMAM